MTMSWGQRTMNSRIVDNRTQKARKKKTHLIRFRRIVTVNLVVVTSKNLPSMGAPIDLVFIAATSKHRLHEVFLVQRGHFLFQLVDAYCGFTERWINWETEELRVE